MGCLYFKFYEGGQTVGQCSALGLDVLCKGEQFECECDAFIESGGDEIDMEILKPSEEGLLTEIRNDLTKVKQMVGDLIKKAEENDPIAEMLERGFLRGTEKEQEG